MKSNRRENKILLSNILFGILCFVLLFMQVSFLKIFGSVPAVTLCLCICIGFFNGEISGGIFGLCSGFMLDLLVSDGLAFSALLYCVAGYLCGYFPRVMLKKNFISFMLYASVVGMVNCTFTLLYITFSAGSLNLIGVFAKILIPEFLSYIVCVPIIYIICLGIVTLNNKIFKQRNHP